MSYITLKKLIAAASTGALLAAGSAAWASEGRAYLIEPKDGATVSSPFTVKFGVEGKTVAPAGDMAPNSGHHHLIIDGAPIAKGEVVPTDDQHLHFGQGQTETELSLPKGRHTLTTQFADFGHQSFGPDWSQTITITVE